MPCINLMMALAIIIINWCKSYNGKIGRLISIVLEDFVPPSAQEPCTLFHISIKLLAIREGLCANVVILPTELVEALREFGQVEVVGHFDGTLTATREMHSDWVRYLDSIIPMLQIVLPEPPPYAEGHLVMLEQLEELQGLQDLPNFVYNDNWISESLVFVNPFRVRNQCDGIFMCLVFDERDIANDLGPDHPCGEELTKDVDLLVVRPEVAARLMAHLPTHFRPIDRSKLTSAWARYFAAAEQLWSGWLRSSWVTSD